MPLIDLPEHSTEKTPPGRDFGRLAQAQNGDRESSKDVDGDSDRVVWAEVVGDGGLRAAVLFSLSLSVGVRVCGGMCVRVRTRACPSPYVRGGRLLQGLHSVTPEREPTA